MPKSVTKVKFTCSFSEILKSYIFNTVKTIIFAGIYINKTPDEIILSPVNTIFLIIVIINV